MSKNSVALIIVQEQELSLFQKEILTKNSILYKHILCKEKQIFPKQIHSIYFLLVCFHAGAAFLSDKLDLLTGFQACVYLCVFMVWSCMWKFEKYQPCPIGSYSNVNPWSHISSFFHSSWGPREAKHSTMSMWSMSWLGKVCPVLFPGPSPSLPWCSAPHWSLILTRPFQVAWEMPSPTRYKASIFHFLESTASGLWTLRAKGPSAMRGCFLQACGNDRSLLSSCSSRARALEKFHVLSRRLCRETVWLCRSS